MDFLERLIVIGSNIAYVAAIALQLAAALLLVGNSNTKREKIIMDFCKKHTAFTFKKDGTMADRTVLEQTVKATWTNYIAFIYLFVGYLVGILGNCTMDRFITLPIVGVVAMVLFVIPFNYAKIKASKFPPITKDEIPNKEGVVIIEYDK